MQTMAQSSLVYRLTDSPVALGILAAARVGPALVGAPLAGVVRDRVSRRDLVLSTQTLNLLQVVLLVTLTLVGAVRA
jgi:hypothetical protein